MADLGFQSNGNNNTIALSNSSTLTSMLTSNLNDVKALFSDPTNGLATQMNNYLTNTIGANGTLPARTADLTQQSTDIGTQISNLETKISNDTNQWNSEFQAMETAESQTNSELTYLVAGSHQRQPLTRHEKQHATNRILSLERSLCAGVGGVVAGPATTIFAPAAFPAACAFSIFHRSTSSASFPPRSKRRRA